MNEKYVKALIKAIKSVYKESETYFTKTKGRERSIVFRIAHILANDIEKHPDIFVDIELTRCNGSTKRANKVIIPDLAIHKRDGTGYLVAEFKCTPNLRQKQKDCSKLELFTMDKSKYVNLKETCPTYMIGAFVYLGNHIDDIRITLFKNGEVMKDKENVPLYEI